MLATAANLPVEDETMNDDRKSPEEAEPPPPPVYETPAIEETITPDDLAREVHYAGVGSEILG